MDIVGIICDVLCEYIYIDGMFLYVVDIVGLWDIEDYVEKIGVECVLKVIGEVDCVLLVVDVIVLEVVDLFFLWLEFFDQ